MCNSLWQWRGQALPPTGKTQEGENNSYKKEPKCYLQLWILQELLLLLCICKAFFSTNFNIPLLGTVQLILLELQKVWLCYWFYDTRHIAEVQKKNLSMACRVEPFSMEKPFVDCKCVCWAPHNCFPTLLLTAPVIFLSPHLSKQTFVPGRQGRAPSWLLRRWDTHARHDMPTLLLSSAEAKAGAGVVAKPCLEFTHLPTQKLTYLPSVWNSL